MPGIRLERLEKRFGRTIAVNDLSLEIGEGEFVSLLGPSGCGKTTILRSLAGLETPDAGSIYMNDQLVFSAAKGLAVAPGKRNIGMVFQSYALWPHLSVFANIAFGLEVKGVNRSDQRERVHKALSLVGIEDLAERYPSELSGGQQQRVALARAIVTEPPILLLDEPLSNLDAKLRLQMRSELQRLHHQLGCTVVYVTHDQLEAMTLSSSIVILRNGILQQIGSPHQIYRQPANGWVADFIGNPSINLLDGITLADGKSIKLNCGPVVPLSFSQLQPDQKVQIGVRPEDLKPVELPGMPNLAGTVHSVQPAGSETFVQLRVGSAIVTIKVSGELDWQLDREVRLWFDERAVLVFGPDSGALLNKVVNG